MAELRNLITRNRDKVYSLRSESESERSESERTERSTSSERNERTTSSKSTESRSSATPVPIPTRVIKLPTGANPHPTRTSTHTSTHARTHTRIPHPTSISIAPVTVGTHTPSSTGRTHTHARKSPSSVLDDIIGEVSEHTSAANMAAASPPSTPLLRRRAVPKPMYTGEEMQSLLSGYVRVHESLWDYIPTRAHIRYNVATGDTSTTTGTFKLGGFVRGHTIDSNGKKLFELETIPGSCSSCGHAYDYTPQKNSYVTYKVGYGEIAELWKKYDHDAFIEIHLIYNSLTEKNKQIEKLTTRVRALERKRGGAAASITQSGEESLY